MLDYLLMKLINLGKLDINNMRILQKKILEKKVKGKHQNQLLKMKMQLKIKLLLKKL